MGTTAKRIAGGLLAGAGRGMLEAAKANRDEVLLALQHENTMQRERVASTRAKTAATTAHERSKGLLSSTITDSGGDVYGITRGAETVKLGITDATQVTAGLSVEDKREMDTAIDRETRGEGSLEGVVIDWDAAAQRLIKAGRPDLAARIASMEDPDSTAIDVESPEYREAQRMAEEWASDQAGYFSKDKTDFANYGGNRAEAIRNKTMELYHQLAGRGTSSVRDTGGSRQDTGNLPGSGTEADPYVATTQTDVDWFRDSAPAGTVAEINGKLYRK